MTNFLTKKVAYGNGVFIATTGDKILKSANGKNWSEVGLNNSNNTEDLSNVIFADGKFLVSGGTYYYISSDNGTTWNEESYIFEITDSTYGDGNFMLVSPNGGCFKINTTTLERTFFTQNLKAVTYFKDTFYGVLNDTENDDGLYRLDGENWTKIHNGLHPGDVCLRGIKNDLYMTVLGMTFIFVWDEEGNVTDFTIAQDYPDAMVDGMEVNGTIYLLTSYCLCEDTSPVLTSNSEDYKCICIDEKNTIYVFSSSNVVTYNVRPVINSIAYGNGVYMAVAGEQVLKSIDGENWETIKTLELNNNTGIVAFGDNVFVVCAGNHYYATKNNGITWTENEYFGVISSICFGDGNFYIAGTNETISIDSETLEVSTANIYSGFASIEYLDGKLYGITTLGSKVWVLNDGQWAEIYSSDDVMDIDYRYLTGCNNRLFLGTSTATYEIVRTPQNASYNLVQLNTSGKLLGSCALNGRCYLLTEMGLYEDEVLVETFGEGSFTAFCANGNTSAFLVAQCINRAVFLEYISAKPYFNIQNVAYSNGTYIAAAGDRILRSTDGENWETVRLTNKTFEDNQLTAVVADNGKFIVSGEMVYYISSDNGITWTEYGSLIPMRNLAYGDGNFMLCSDEFDNTLIIDSDTMSFNWAFPGVCMNDIAFANGEFYGIKYSENGSELCKYDFAGNSWIPFVTGLTLAENPKLFSAGDRLFLGNNGATYEFTKNTEGEFSAMTSCAYIDGEVIDACKSGEETYILTADRMYQGTILTTMFVEGNYTSILNIPVDNTEKLVMFDGKEFSIFEPMQPVTEYRIKSVAYNDGVYVAAAGDKVLKSFDCENWFQVKSSEDGNICKVVFGDGKFLVCGGHNYYISKDNGITWIEGTTKEFMQYAAYGDVRFIITSDTDKTLQIDSETLECTVLELSIPMGDVVFWEGKFVAVNNDSVMSKIYQLEEDNHWKKRHIYHCPDIIKEEKTLRVCNGRLFIGINDTTLEIIYDDDEDYKINDSISAEPLVDSCEVWGNEYVLTSYTLYENGVTVQTVPEGRVFTCCTAGKSPVSLLSSYEEFDSNIVQTYYEATSEEDNNISQKGSYSPAVDETPKVYSKTGTVKYAVIADTHNSPWGYRKLEDFDDDCKYLFDLGDNTLAYQDPDHKQGKNRYFLDAVDYPEADLRAYGNHDVYKLGGFPKANKSIIIDKNNNFVRQNVEKWECCCEDKKNKVLIYALNSSISQNEYHIPIDEIKDLAFKLMNLKNNWDVIILTHVPLFDADESIYGDAWSGDDYTESKGNNNYKWKELDGTHDWCNMGNRTLLLNLLRNFNAHSSDGSIEIDGKKYNYSHNNGHVIGCFAGHVHNHFVNTQNGLYMETFPSNGSESSPSAKWQVNPSIGHFPPPKHGTYIPKKYNIRINFDKMTVNDKSFVDLDNKIECKDEASVHKPETLARQSTGPLRFAQNSPYYPKFYEDGTYVGFSKSVTKGKTDDYKFSAKNYSWRLGEKPIDIYINNLYKCSAKSIVFDASGRLRYYYPGDEQEEEFIEEIPKYKTGAVHFVANNIRWDFVEGKYQIPKSESYTLDDKYYPAFDTDGRYIGWSDYPDDYLIGERTSNEGTRKWKVTTGDLPILAIVTDPRGGKPWPKSVTHIIFGEDGKLKSLILTSGAKYKCPDDSDIKLIMDDKTEWTFIKQLFKEAKPKTAGSKYCSTSDIVMRFTDTPYHFTFKNGYLYSYRRTDDPEETERRDDIGSEWKCYKHVYFYASAYDAYNNIYFDSDYQNTLYFEEKSSSTGYYIDNLKYENRGLYAQINGSFFYADGTNGWRLVKLNP